MPVTLVTATIPNNDTLPIDEVRFGWVMDLGALVATDLQNIFDTFFNTVQVGAANKTADYLASCLTLGETSPNVRLAGYDITAHLDGSPHGSPYVTAGSHLQTIGGDSRGNQLCAVIGIQSAAYETTPVEGPVGPIPNTESANDQAGLPPGSTHSGTTKLRARQAGRIYLGPLDASAIGVDADANPKFTDTFKTDITANLAGFLASWPQWSVWSRRGAAIHHVTHGWLDLSVMTRRKKGFNSKLRAAWS